MGRFSLIRNPSIQPFQAAFSNGTEGAGLSQHQQSYEGFQHELRLLHRDLDGPLSLKSCWFPPCLTVVGAMGSAQCESWKGRDLLQVIQQGEYPLSFRSISALPRHQRGTHRPRREARRSPVATPESDRSRQERAPREGRWSIYCPRTLGRHMPGFLFGP